MKPRITTTGSLCLAGLTLVLVAALPGVSAWGQQAGQSGINRLLQRADIAAQHAIESNQKKSSPSKASGTCLIPGQIRSARRADQASFSTKQPTNQETQFIDRSATTIEGIAIPMPYSKPGAAGKGAAHHRFHQHAPPEEYLFDGNDRGKRVIVGENWDVYGLDTEDTVGHFDTLDGRRIVTPSNRVAIYAPRFASVRKIDGLINAQRNQIVNAINERQQTILSNGSNNSSTSKQHLSLNRYKGSKRASGILDQTRGVAADNTTHLFGMRNSMETFNSNGLLKVDRLDGAFAAAMQTGIQSAVAWESDLGLRVVAQGVQPIIVRDVATAQELKHIESEDGTAILSVVKSASKMSARPGEIVEFTIRFDNISAKKIGNVTLMDNLTRRLEFVKGSSQCSLECKFENAVNDSESLVLRWEISEPLEPGQGGVIRFQCRAR